MLTRRSLLQGAAFAAVAGLVRPSFAADEPLPGLPRDIVLLDGKEPGDVPPGAPSSWHAKLKLDEAAPRPVVAEFNEERIVARPWPLKDNRMTIAELTY